MEITPGGKHLPHNGKVYFCQPDPDLHTVEDTIKPKLVILEEGSPRRVSLSNAIKRTLN